MSKFGARLGMGGSQARLQQPAGLSEEESEQHPREVPISLRTRSLSDIIREVPKERPGPHVGERRQEGGGPSQRKKLRSSDNGQASALEGENNEGMTARRVLRPRRPIVDDGGPSQNSDAQDIRATRASGYHAEEHSSEEKHGKKDVDQRGVAARNSKEKSVTVQKIGKGTYENMPRRGKNWLADEYYCTMCKFWGCDKEMLLCDNTGCPRAFHTFCLKPPVHEVPEGTWICPVCLPREGLYSKSPLVPKVVEAVLGCKESSELKEGELFDEARLIFFVKWEGLSHRHNTWVPGEALLHINEKKVHNFVRRHRTHLGVMNLPIDESKEEWRTVDRVLTCVEVKSATKKKTMKKSVPAVGTSAASTATLQHDDATMMNYLVKWRGLDYEQSTWEERLVGDDFDDAFAAYSRRILESSSDGTGKRRREGRDGPQPVQRSWEEVKGSLYDYQVEGVEWLLNNFKQQPPRSAILADEMGLGKTIQAAVFLARVRNERLSMRPSLVVAPVTTLVNWEQELRTWAPSLNCVIYKGSPASRVLIQQYEFGGSAKAKAEAGSAAPHVLVVGYEMAMGDSPFLQKMHWGTLIVDEGHKVKDCRSKLSRLLQSKKTDFRILLTGTPIQNNLTELFSLLHFINPSSFGDPERAAANFASRSTGAATATAIATASSEDVGGTTTADGKDKEEDRQTALSNLHELLRPQMLRRLKANVLKLPPRRLVEVPCALTPLQRSLYIDILERNYDALFSGSGKKRSLSNVLVNLKVILNHPYLFPSVEPEDPGQDKLEVMIAASGKFQLLAQLLPRLRERGHRVLIFSQSTRLLNLLEVFLHAFQFPFFRLDGATPQVRRQQQIDAFNRSDAREFIFLISTRAGGLGINLQTADTVIIYDPDYNPFADEQAQARAHRIGQEKPVVVYQLFTKCTVEERILEVLGPSIDRSMPSSSSS